MPIVCINRPNRTKRRVFRCADVRRITRYAVASGETPECILNGMLDELGYKESVCTIIKIIRVVRDIKENAAYVAVLSALITIISGISSILRRRDRAALAGVVVRNPIVRRFAALWDAITAVLDRTPIGAVLIGLGSIQLLLITARNLIDVWDDLIEPLLRAVACEEN